MIGSPRCGGCGVELPVGASYCMRCGRSTTPELRELEIIGAGARATEGGGREQVLSDSRGGAPRRRGAAALAAIGAVLVGVVLLLSGGGDGEGDDAAAAPTTTRVGTPDTKLNYPDPTRPGETTSTRPPSTSRPTTTTSTTTTVVTYLGAAPAPVLGTETGGLSLYAAGDGVLRRIELDTGRLTTIELDQDVGLLRVRGDRLELDTGGGLFAIAADLSGELSWLGPSSYGTDIRVPGSDDAWSIERGDGQGQLVLRRGGEVVLRYDIPGGSSLAGIVGDRAVLQGGGRIFTLDPDGRLRAYGTGQVVSASEQWLLWWACDDQLRCEYRLGDAVEPQARRVVTPPELASTMYGYGYGYGIGSPSLVSPDGRFALLNGIDGLRLVDLTDGRVLPDETSWGPWAWLPDNRWLLRYDERGGIVAVSTADGSSIPVMPSVRSVQNGPRALAVG